jgi:hypothetical protein
MAELLADGFVSLLGGCNAGLAPTLLPATQFAAGVNLSCRDGLVRTRPSFRKLRTLGSGTQFQGAATYRLVDTDRIVYAIDGVVRIYNIATNTITALSPPIAMNSTVETMYFAQADRYMIVQDGETRPLFIHQDKLFRQAIPYQAYDPTYTGTANEVYTGTVTAFGHGRVFTSARRIHANNGLPLSLTEGRPYFVAGDVRLPNNPSTVLNFTETTYLSGGGAAGLPSEYGFVQGMGFFRNVQSGTGLGPLIVFAKYGVGAFNVNTPRDDWQDTDFSQVLFSDIGTLSPRSIVPMNDDLLFRALDGLRSLRYTASQVSGGSGTLSATSISHEVQPWLDMDSLADLPFVSVAVADNRAFMTSGGRTGQGFNALVCLDAAPAHGISGALVPPAYAGIWTGAKFLQVLRGEVAGVITLLALVANGDAVELWYLDPDQEIYRDNETKQTLCRLYTGAFAFGGVRSLKKFSHVDVWVRDLRGDATLTAYYRPEGYSLWNACNSVSLVADYETAGALPQRRYRVRLSPTSDDVYDPATNIHLGQGNSFQICLEWEGSLALEKVTVAALPVSEEPGVCCDEGDTAVALVEGTGGVSLDNFSYNMV